MLAEPVESVMCQTKPICRTELVSTETSSPPHTHASFNLQERTIAPSSLCDNRTALILA